MFSELYLENLPNLKQEIAKQGSARLQEKKGTRMENVDESQRTCVTEVEISTPKVAGKRKHDYIVKMHAMLSKIKNLCAGGQVTRSVTIRAKCSNVEPKILVS